MQSQVADVARGAATWKTGQTYASSLRLAHLLHYVKDDVINSGT